MSKNRKKGYVIYIIVLAIVVAGAVGVYIHNRDTADKNDTKPFVAKGTQSTPTPPAVAGSNLTSGGAVNTNGNTTSTLPPASEWTTSSGGQITLQQPTNNATLSTGDTISGLAKVSTVQFVLTDNSVGQIAQGNLNVVNGKFSGTISFTAHSSTGNLELYYPNPSNGAEEYIINVSVKYDN